jgi:hypothetical protein
MKTKWLLALLLLPAHAWSACPPNVPPDRACVQWQASSGWSDNSPFTPGTVVTYRVYRLTPPGATLVYTTTALNTPNLAGFPKGEQCFFVRASVNGTESANSNTACKTLRFPGPTDGSIVGPTDGSIEQPKH